MKFLRSIPRNIIQHLVSGLILIIGATAWIYIETSDPNYCCGANIGIGLVAVIGYGLLLISLVKFVVWLVNRN